jgi:hypothetical protein
VTVLRIEHPVPDFDTWKREGFDRDPIGRAQGGVRGYRIFRAVDDPNFVVVDLEFDDDESARAFAAALAALWRRVQERFAWRELPRARILETVEST